MFIIVSNIKIFDLYLKFDVWIWSIYRRMYYSITDTKSDGNSEHHHQYQNHQHLQKLAWFLISIPSIPWWEWEWRCRWCMFRWWWSYWWGGGLRKKKKHERLVTAVVVVVVVSGGVGAAGVVVWDDAFRPLSLLLKMTMVMMNNLVLVVVCCCYCWGNIWRLIPPEDRQTQQRRIKIQRKQRGYSEWSCCVVLCCVVVAIIVGCMLLILMLIEE